MTVRRVALASWVVCVVATLASLVFLGMGVGQSTPGDTFVLGGAGGFAIAFAGLAFGSVGVLVALRLPENRVGRVFCVIGFLLGFGNFTYQYADQVLYGSATGLPGGTTTAVLQNALVPPAFGLVAVTLMLFPDGRLPSQWWRPAVALALLGSSFTLVGYTLRPGKLDSPFETVTNPLGLHGQFALWEDVSAFGWPMMAIGLVLAAVAMSRRLMRSHGLEREQLKWVAFAASVAGVMIAFDVASFFAEDEGTLATTNLLRAAALGIGFSVIPIAAGVAILRYRLYDIDVVINRALVYGSLTATLAAVYLGSILVLQLLLETFTAGSGLAVAASTLATAALVRPARARIQAAVDRRFFRRKYDAVHTLAVFAARLRNQVDLDAVQTDLSSVVAETMQPEHLTLWLRNPTVPVTVSGRSSRRQE